MAFVALNGSARGRGVGEPGVKPGVGRGFLRGVPARGSPTASRWGSRPHGCRHAHADAEPARAAPGSSCHRWRYALRWEQPSRLAILKNVLGNSVTTYTDYKAPGSGIQDDWPDPIDDSEIADAWKYTAPSQPTTRPYDHDCGLGFGVPARCPTDGRRGRASRNLLLEGNLGLARPGPELDAGPQLRPLIPARSIIPGVDTTGSHVLPGPVQGPADLLASPDGRRARRPMATAGTYDGWAWTLNYGYGRLPDQRHRLRARSGSAADSSRSPGMGLMDETTDNSCGARMRELDPRDRRERRCPSRSAWTTRGGARHRARDPDHRRKKIRAARPSCPVQRSDARH